jgi:hypothetical protein
MRAARKLHTTTEPATPPVRPVARVHWTSRGSLRWTFTHEQTWFAARERAWSKLGTEDVGEARAVDEDFGGCMHQVVTGPTSTELLNMRLRRDGLHPGYLSLTAAGALKETRCPW